MSPTFRNEIDIKVMASGGTIADVAIVPRSRPPLTRLFAGKPSASLLAVLPRLFSLCSLAHRVALQSAIEAARGDGQPSEQVERRVTAVVAERLRELLRGLFVGLLTPDGASVAAVRAVMQATTVLSGSVRGGPEPSRREAASQIRTALSTLGIMGEDQAPAPGSRLAARLASLEGDILQWPAAEVSFLSAADDLDIVMRLLADDGARFAAAPELHGRIPETGIWARRVRGEQITPQAASPAMRFKARVAEVARLGAWLDAGGESPDDYVVDSYRLGPGKGAAALECARGRLYHAVELDNGGRVIHFEFLAPTEWNFHCRGPLVRVLQGARLAAGPPGRDAVRALIDSFDPCVGFSLDFREVGHA